MMADETVGDRYLVPGLVRGLTALKLFTPERSALTLAEIARALGISRSAAFRTVYTLTEMGCLLHDEREQRYALGPGVMRLSYGYFATREVVEIAQGELEKLRGVTGWSVHLGVRDGTSVLYLIRIAGDRHNAALVQVGSRLPARNTTLGRVLLADLSETELVSLFRLDAAGLSKGRSPALPAILSRAAQDRQTEAVVHAGDFEAGIVSAAAPVRDMTGRVIAAINVTAPHTPDALADLDSDVRDVLVATAGRISRMLGWDGSMQTAKAS
jgi:DNA-binding IclR family transcriptional regulator